MQHCATILVDFKLLVCLFSEAKQEQEMSKPSSEDLSNLVQSGVDIQSYQPVGDIKTQIMSRLSSRCLVDNMHS